MSNNKAQSKTKSRKKPRKVHAVGVGDVVKFYSPLEGQSGKVGTVTAVLDTSRVVIKAEASRYEQFSGTEWVIRTSKPRGVNKHTGDQKWIHMFWIDKVLFRKNDYAPKPPKVKPEPKVLTSAEELLDHLQSGDSKEKAVYIPEVAP